MSDLVMPEDVKEILSVSDYSVGELVGKGGTATVWKAKQNHKQFAIKFIQIESLSENKKRYLEREIKIVLEISHQFIIKTHKVLKYKKQYVFIISDLAERDLIQVLESDEEIEYNQKKQWFSQIVSAVAYLHSLGIAHRDLKADNILIHNGIAKLTDFGFALHSIDSNGEEIECQSLCGTIEYQSVEVLSMVSYNPFISDSFSLGVILFTIITHSFPFGSGPVFRSFEGIEELKDNIIKQNWELPEQYPNHEELFDLLKQLLTSDPNSRLRSNQILSHKWFKT